MQHFTLHMLVVGLVRRTWFVVLVAVILCAGFAARGVAALVEADYLAPMPTPGTPLPAGARQAARPARTPPDSSGFVARNMFCSTCDPEPSGPGPTDASYTGRPAVLIATSMGLDPRATVRVLETEVQGSWGVRDQIPGVGTVTRIGWTSIDVVDGTGRLAKLSLIETGAPPPPPVAAADDAPFSARIKKLDDTTYEVDRALVRELVSDTAKAGKMRMLPIIGKEGEVKGVRVLGVSAGSLGAALGLRNADVISAIDGEPIKTAQQMLDLYAKLDQLSTVELQGTRAGKPLVRTLKLR